MTKKLLTRRTVLQATAATALSAPFVRGAFAAGKLSFGVWDHWVPGAAEELKKICAEWAAKEKVDLNVDLITSNGDKDLLTLMAEGQAKAGHDMMGLRTWYVSAQADNFVPVDDIVLPVIKEYGRSHRLPNTPAKSTAIGWRCRRAMAMVPCRLARASTT